MTVVHRDTAEVLPVFWFTARQRGHQELMVSTGTLIYVALEASLLTMDFPLNEVIHTPHIHSPIHSFNECIECPPHARHMHRPCKQSR